MGLVYADIELVNCDDISVARQGYIKESEIRSKKVRALVDSGAYMMCLNEHLRAQLGVATVRTTEIELADGQIKTLDVVGPIRVNFENRSAICSAVVLPGNSEVLLGAIPMEEMDVVIDPKEQKLTLPQDRPYLALTKVK
jgi:clan AA aspartic protease